MMSGALSIIYKTITGGGIAHRDTGKFHGGPVAVRAAIINLYL